MESGKVMASLLISQVKHIKGTGSKADSWGLDSDDKNLTTCNYNEHMCYLRRRFKNQKVKKILTYIIKT